MSNLPKNFVLQLGSLITLYVSIAALLTLIFNTINVAIPDAAAGSWEWSSSQTAMRSSLAILIVFFPVYLALTRIVNQTRRNSEAIYSALTKWAIYISLLIAGIAMLIDLVVVIMFFLEGEITTRFLMKALAVVLVLGAVFYYYLRDAQGYWQMRMGMSVMYGAVATAIVLGAIVASLYHLEMPNEAREARIDNEQLGVLQDMQWRTEEYYRSNEKLPTDLAELYGEFPVPTAPDGRSAYEYKVTGEKTYELCATFVRDSSVTGNDYSVARPVTGPGLSKNYNWDYKPGNWCFEREIDDVYKQ